jgi:hypothetical protein
MNTPNKPPTDIVRERVRLSLNDLTIRSLGMDRIEEGHIKRVCKKIFDNLDYNNLKKDSEVVATSFVNLSRMLTTHELRLTGSVIPFELAYGGIIIESSIHMTVKDEKRGYIYPVVVDFSKTKYEPHYNPVIYRCHTIAKHLDIIGTNTDVTVLSVMSGKRWIYEKRKYGNILEASIAETLFCMREGCYPVRMGWWCASCSGYRGICHKLLSKRT